MPVTTPQTAFRSFLYGGGAMLLAFDVFFLIKAFLTSNYIPILPILLGILTALGLLLIIYAEQRAREEDRRDHRRISRVAHQLESPLHSLEVDISEIMQQADSLPAEVKLKLKRMETKSKVLLENIRDVFLLLQVQEQPVSRDIRTYNLCNLVHDVVQEQKKLASARNVELITKAHCQDAPVRVDRQLLMIVLTHLVENAILYTLTPGLVNVAITKGKDSARVVVQDRGIGVQTGDMRQIFQPFARGARAEQYDPDGIGVGLTLSQLLVKEWHGKIKWTNRTGAAGTQFEIILPLAKR